MSRYTNKPYSPAYPCFKKCLEGTSRSCNFFKIIFCPDIMNLPQVKILGVQSLKTLFKVR